MSSLAPTDWSRLHHAYGPATDVPGHLAALSSPDPAERRAAVSALTGSVCHQGTRWQASAAVVAPLVELVASTAAPDRATVLDVLRAVAIGGRVEDGLPFDPAREFAAGDRIGPGEVAAVTRALFHDGAVEDVDDLADAVAVRWAADAYRATERRLGTVAGWLRDQDPEVVARAAALLAWFPQNPDVADALAAVPVGAGEPRASANLAAAHLSGPATPRERRALTASLTSPQETVRVTAAVALAHREGASLPDEALSVLAACSGREVAGAVPGWERSLRGHVALALRRLGL